VRYEHRLAPNDRRDYGDGRQIGCGKPPSVAAATRDDPVTVE
jgi:hypothetical protein